VSASALNVYVPGILATVAHLLFLVKYLSPAAAVPSTADKSAVTVTAPLVAEFGVRLI